MQAEQDLAKNGTANSSPAALSVTSLIKEAGQQQQPAAAIAGAASGDAELANKVNHKSTMITNDGGAGQSKQFLADDYMAKILGGRDSADRSGRLKVQGGQSVRQVLSNKV